jgi:ABC-type multidrug transport system fused ATPase/permease subunit
MADSHAKDVSIAGLVALLAFLAYKHTQVPPLEAPHVGAEKAAETGSQINLQRFDAQLWQDPFAVLAVAGAGAGGSADRKHAPASDRQWTPLPDLKQWIANQRASRCTVLLAGMLTDTNPNPDRAEARRRQRVAVHEGLQAQKAGLVDTFHIGGLRYKPAALERAPSAYPVDIPFELFERPSSAELPECLAVVLLWLDSAYFLPMSGQAAPLAPGRSGAFPNPIAGLRTLLDGLAGADRPKSGNVKRVLFGPEDSDQLRHLLMQSREGTQQHNFAPLTIYSYSSTAPLPSLLDPPPPGAKHKDVASDLKARQASVKFQLVRTIRDDLRIWTQLWAEIEGRRVATGGRRGRVVVVNSFGQLYAERLAAMGALSGEWGSIRAYRFMADLNGSRARPHDTEAAPGERAAGDGKQQDRQDPRGGHVRSEGNEQFDYVERLAETIVSDLGDIGDDFLAIGVFGGDAHDKITLIRALRNRLDRALFFTTDLDMRLLDPEHIKYTRNTLVGSAYGLALDEHLQAGFAPFRDGYQTSLFFTVQLALGQQTASMYTWNGRSSEKTACFAEADKLGDCRAWMEQMDLGISGLAPAGERGHVFEIGLDRFIPLSTGRQPDDTRKAVAGNDTTSLSAQLAPIGVGLVVLAFLVLTVFGMSKLVVGAEPKWVPCPRDLWKVCREDRWDKLWYAVVALLVVSVIVWLAKLTGVAAYETWGNRSGEPSALFQGVSIWGCIVFRWAGILLAVWYLVLFLEIYLNDKEHSAPAQPASGSAPVRWSAAVRGLANAIWPQLHHKLQPAASGESVWAVYLRCTAISEVVVAALLHVAAISLLMEALLAVGGQAADFTRSETSHTLYFLSGRASAWLLFLLLFITTFVFRLCRDWMEFQAGTEADAERIQWSSAERLRVLDTYGLAKYERSARMSEVADLMVTLKKIGNHTDAICRFVYAPFVVLAVMLLSTWQRFEYFQWPVSAVLLLAFVILWAVYNAFILDRAGTRVKSNILAVLNRRVAMLTGVYQGDASLKDMLAALQHDATEMSEGAFKPLLEQPYLRALLLPAGASTLLTVLELFKF